MPRKHKEGVVVKLHSFLTSVLDGAEQSAVRLGQRQNVPCTLSGKQGVGVSGTFRRKVFCLCWV